MSKLPLLSEAQMRRLQPFFPISRGLRRVDDRRVISGIIDVIQYGMQWKDALSGYGPPKTLYNRFIRWSRLGVFARIFAALTAKGGAPARLMIDATLSNSLQKGFFRTFGADAIGAVALLGSSGMENAVPQ